MSKVTEIDENRYFVEVFTSNSDLLKKWAETCNCTSVSKKAIMKYVITFSSHENLKDFVSQLSVNCK